jgi:[protein-PII] uridylyltransferase
VDQGRAEALWDGFPEAYFLRHQGDEIAWQTEAIAGHRDRETPLVLVRNSTESNVANTTQIFIHARSGAYLFPRICVELEHLHLSIHGARIYEADDAMGVDNFFVLDSDGRSIAEDGERLRNISERLTSSLSDHGSVTPLARRRTPRQMKSFPIPTETRMSVDDNMNLSVLEVAAPDRPGLLARIARIFVDHGVELQAAKIQTLGERVEDVFFLTDANQLPITDAALAEDIQRAIREELDEAAA